MPKNTRISQKKNVRHDHVAMAALAFVALATLIGADVFSSPETQTIAHANTSANPYQPVQTYVPRTGASHSERSSYVSSVNSTTILRRIIVLERSVKTITRQLRRIENRIDALDAALQVAEPKNLLSLRSALDELTALRDRLEQRLAEANSKLAEYLLQQER